MNGVIALVMIVGAVVSAAIASGKNRSVAGWAVFGALFPLISAVFVATLPPEPAPDVVVGS
jgi:hypothetical protein